MSQSAQCRQQRAAIVTRMQVFDITAQPVSTNPEGRRVADGRTWSGDSVPLEGSPDRQVCHNMLVCGAYQHYGASL